LKLARALRIERKEIVALVGGGGKTSAMFRLGDELAGQGWRVVLTTSTHLGADQVHKVPHIILPPRLPTTHLPIYYSPTLVTGPIDSYSNKTAGLPPALIDRLIPDLGADAVINEADGARTLPFKAPAGHEPVITPGTTLLVPVMGIDAIGQALDAAHVHRPERVAALAEAEMGQPVTPETVAAVLTHPQGGLKSVLPGARVLVLINKVESKVQLSAARRLADLLLACPRIEAVAIGALQRPDPVHELRSRAAVVVLAAGEARRFGRLKQLEPFGGGTLLTHAVDVARASRAGRVIVVLGCRAEECRAALADRPVTVVINPDWAQGQSTSVRAGLAALAPNTGAVVFHLVDQPGVTPAVIDALIARHATTLAPVVWPEYAGRRGNPVLFDRITFPRFQTLNGDVGARPVLLTYAGQGLAERVAVDEPGVLMDVDAPQDL